MIATSERIEMMNGGITLSGLTAEHVRGALSEALDKHCDDATTEWPDHLVPDGKCFPIAKRTVGRPCPACKGEQVRVIEGVSFRCQACSEGRVYDRERWIAPEKPDPWIIGQVIVVLDAKEGVWIKATWKHLVMAETNIKDLFPTIEAARAECTKRNNELEAVGK